MALKVQNLHFDSAYATYLTDLNNTSGNVSNCYKALFLTNQTFRNVKRVHLKSVEIPIGFVNVRTGSTDTFSFTLNGVNYSVVLAEHNYISIASLIIALNIACSTSSVPITMAFSLNSANRVMINFVTSSAFTFNVIDTNFSYYLLGYRGATDTVLNGQCTANSSNFNLNFDNYISMSIPTLNSTNAYMSGTISTFKIPLNSQTNQIYYYFDNFSFNQFVDIADVNFVLSSLTIILTDRFGKNLNPNGLDYSFTLQIEYI